jgi:hypothetical protein
MDDVTEIRRRVARGESMRTLAASLGVSRRTVRRYVDGAPPETRRAAVTPRARPKQEAIGAVQGPGRTNGWARRTPARRR